jgi:hypothetical protein
MPMPLSNPLLPRHSPCAIPNVHEVDRNKKEDNSQVSQILENQAEILKLYRQVPSLLFPH